MTYFTQLLPDLEQSKLLRDILRPYIVGGTPLNMITQEEIEIIEPVYIKLIKDLRDVHDGR